MGNPTQHQYRGFQSWTTTDSRGIARRTVGGDRWSPRDGTLRQANFRRMSNDRRKQMFENLRRIMTAAGGSLEHIARVTVFVAVPDARVAVNEEWVRAFPDPASRPARHMFVDYNLPGGLVVQCDATAWIG